MAHIAIKSITPLFHYMQGEMSTGILCIGRETMRNDTQLADRETGHQMNKERDREGDSSRGN